MPLLKEHRGTVLIIDLMYQNLALPVSVKSVQVFNNLIGGVRESDFLMEDGSVVPFGSISPDLGGITAERVIVYGIYPDGNYVMNNNILFANTIEVVWAESRILAAVPFIDADWHKNPTMLIVTPSGQSTWHK